MNRDRPKQSLKHHQSSPVSTIHVNLKLLLGMSTTFSSPSSAVNVGDQLHHHCSPRFRYHTEQSKPWSVTCVLRPVEYSCCETFSVSPRLCTLFDVCSQVLDCASVLDRVCRFQPLCLLMAARQTSIITTTAPPAPALAANVETEPAVFTSDVVLPTRVEQHQSAITLLLALVTRVRAAKIAPRKVLARIIPSLLIQLTIASFQSLRTKVARILFRAAANHIELPFTQSLLVPQITRLQMSHPTATDSVNHATRSV